MRKAKGGSCEVCGKIKIGGSKPDVWPGGASPTCKCVLPVREDMEHI